MWFANPAALWALLLIPPLLLLYMLRHRPVRQRVPSLLLWQGVADAQVSTSPFQWLRRSVSLLLMLAALLLLVLALSGLRIPEGRAAGLPLVVVLDTTASMQAETENGTRIDLARELAADAIRNAGNAPITVLAWDGRLQGVGLAESSPALALAALGRLAATDRSGDDLALSRALRQLRADDARVLFIGTRRPGADVRYLSVDESRPNTAIIAAGLNELQPGAPEIYFVAELTGATGSLVTTLVVERFSNGEWTLVDARDVTLSAGRRGEFSFRVSESGLYRGRLDYADAFALDNSALVRFTRLPALAVRMDDGVPDQVQRAVNAVASGMTGFADTADERHTTWVFGSEAAAGVSSRLPAAYIGPAAHPPGVRFGGFTDADDAAAILAPSFLWRGVGEPELRVVRTAAFTHARETRPVLEASAGPAIALAERTDSRHDLLFCLDFADDSGANTLLERPAFVILWANWLAHVREGLDPLPRGALSVRDSVRGEYTATAPTGAEYDATQGIDLAHVGVYRTTGAETEVEYFGVSLLDPRASDLTVQPGESPVEVTDWLRRASQSGERGALELAPWLALAGLTLLMIEWFLYRRRFFKGRD